MISEMPLTGFSFRTVVHELGGHERFEQADQGHAEGDGADDPEGLHRERRLGDEQLRQGAGQFVLVGDVGEVPAGDPDAGGDGDDGDEWGGDDGRPAG